MEFSSRGEEWGLAVVGGDFLGTAILDKDLGNLFVAPLAGPVKSRPPSIVLQIRLGALVEQEPRMIEETHLRRDRDRGLSVPEREEKVREAGKEEWVGWRDKLCHALGRDHVGVDALWELMDPQHVRNISESRELRWGWLTVVCVSHCLKRTNSNSFATALPGN